MNVLIPLYAFYPSQLGGPCNTLYWIGKELTKRGHKVTAVVSNKGIADNTIKSDEWVYLDGIKIKYCNTKKPKLSLKIIWESLKLVPKTDTLIFSSLFYIPYLLIGVIGIILKKKIIWSPRGELFEAAIKGRHKGKLLYLQILKVLFGKRAIFNVTSREEKDLVYKYFGDNAKCILIENYMELPEKIEIQSTCNYLLYVGRITPIKALENLILGLSLSKKFLSSDYQLYLAGANTGDYYESLKLLISEKKLDNKVVFKGMVFGKEKEKLYAGAKATLLVSHSENFGNVVIESLAQGTPVIASYGTPWKILTETGSGYWINNSPVSISNTIDTFISMSDHDYKKMRNISCEFCRKNFDIVTNINKWIEII